MVTGKATANEEDRLSKFRQIMFVFSQKENEGRIEIDPPSFLTA